MKKILSISVALFTMFAVLLSMTIRADALVMEKVIKGTLSGIIYTQTGSDEEIRFTKPDTATLGKPFLLPPNEDSKYYRLVFQITGASVNTNDAFVVDRGTVYQVRYALVKEPLAVSVVVETTKSPQYTLTESSDKKSVVLKITGGVTTSTPTPTPTPTPSATPASTPTPSSTPTPTPSSTVTPTPTPTPSVTTTPTPSSTPTPTPVPNKNGPLSWNISGDTCTFKLEGIGLSQSASSSEARFELREREKILQISLPGNVTSLTAGGTVINNVVHGILVNYNTKLNTTLIRITYPNAITFTHEVKDGSSVITVKKGSTSAPEATPSITPTPSSTPTSSVTPTPSSTTTPDSSDTPTPNPSTSATPTPTPSVTPNSGENYMDLTSVGITNVLASVTDSSVAFKITSPGIVASYRQLADSIVVEDDISLGQFAFRLPLSMVNMGGGKAVLNSKLVKSVTTLSTDQNSFLLFIKQDPEGQFTIKEGSSPDELFIILATSQYEGNTGSGTAKNKLVVLDAGHGGTDPGGVVGTYYEKNYNLPIALYCEAYLKAKGVNVMMTRSTDVFITLDGRSALANDNKADLFVSIHNNIMPAASYKGSMTLYYPSSVDGKAYASIVQENLVNGLGMADMNIRPRGDLSVLKKTKMPAVLAEFACMTNSDDLNLLNNDAFLKKAGENLGESIIKILASMP